MRLLNKILSLDCLCIIQDDPLDWEREAAAMGNLYLNSYVTISAAASTDSASGCFPKRNNECSYKSCATISLGYKTKTQAPGSDTCSLQVAGPDGTAMELHLMKEWLPGSASARPQISTMGAFGKQFDPIADEPLSSRGMDLCPAIGIRIGLLTDDSPRLDPAGAAIAFEGYTLCQGPNLL